MARACHMLTGFRSICSVACLLASEGGKRTQDNELILIIIYFAKVKISYCARKFSVTRAYTRLSYVDWIPIHLFGRLFVSP